MSLLRESLKKAPIVKRGGYDYVIHPITDGIPEIEPDLLKEVAREMERYIERIQPIDRIVTIEAMGIPLATLVSIDMGIPFTIVRKREYGLVNEVSVQQVTGYSKSRLFINGIKRGDRVVIVDDVLSTGGTLKAVISSLQEIGAIVKGIVIAINKGKAVNEIQKLFNIPVTIIADIEVEGSKVKIKSCKTG